MNSEKCQASNEKQRSMKSWKPHEKKKCFQEKKMTILPTLGKYN